METNESGDAWVLARLAALERTNRLLWAGLALTFTTILSLGLAAALLAASEVAFTILKIVGALYLAYLGVSMIVKSFRKHAIEKDVATPVGTLGAAFGRGAITNLLNPKVGVFYIALIPQFIPEGVPPVGMGLLLALVHVVESLVWFTGLIIAAHFARKWLSSPRVSAWIDRVTGGILVAFGAATASGVVDRGHRIGGALLGWECHSFIGALPATSSPAVSHPSQFHPRRGGPPLEPEPPDSRRPRVRG